MKDGSSSSAVTTTAATLTPASAHRTLWLLLPSSDNLATRWASRRWPLLDKARALHLTAEAVPDLAPEHGPPRAGRAWIRPPRMPHTEARGRTQSDNQGRIQYTSPTTTTHPQVGKCSTRRHTYEDRVWRVRHPPPLRRCRCDGHSHLTRQTRTTRMSSAHHAQPAACSTSSAGLLTGQRQPTWTPAGKPTPDLPIPLPLKAFKTLPATGTGKAVLSLEPAGSHQSAQSHTATK